MKIIDRLYKNCLSSIHSIQFLRTVSSPVTKAPTCVLYEYNGCSADFYATNPKKKKGLVVLFHGANQMGNKDLRFQPLINALLNRGYDCLMPQLSACASIHPVTSDDVNEEVELLNYLFENKLDTNGKLILIGFSVAAYFTIRTAAHQKLKEPVQSICLFSSYFNTSSFRELLEEKREFYAQLVTLKLILMYANELQITQISDRDFLIFNQVIAFCDLHSHEPNIHELVLQFLDSKEPECKELGTWISQLGTPHFLNEQLYPAFTALATGISYQEELTKIKCKIGIIHSYNDSVFSAENSRELANFLNAHHMKNRLCITKLLEHVKIVPSQLLKESVNLIKELNYIFN